MDFLWKSTPTRHIKYKVKNFAPSNKSIMAIKLPSTFNFYVKFELPKHKITDLIKANPMQARINYNKVDRIRAKA